jgi:hypothetical protein
MNFWTCVTGWLSERAGEAIRVPTIIHPRSLFTERNTHMKHILLVLSNAVEGSDHAFNTWYDGTHLPDVLKVHGFSAAQRFRISDTQMNGDAAPYKYLAIYEVDEEKLPAVKDALASTAGTDAMYIDPALDRDATVAYFYTPITGKVQASANASAAQPVIA